MILSYSSCKGHQSLKPSNHSTFLKSSSWQSSHRDVVSQVYCHHPIFSLYPYICHQQFLHYPSILSQFNPFSLFLDNKITGEFSAFPRVRRCCLFPRCPAAQLCLWDSALCLAARALSLQLQKKSMPLGHGILPSTVGKLTGNG